MPTCSESFCVLMWNRDRSIGLDTSQCADEDLLVGDAAYLGHATLENTGAGTTASQNELCSRVRARAYDPGRSRSQSCSRGQSAKIRRRLQNGMPGSTRPTLGIRGAAGMPRALGRLGHCYRRRCSLDGRLDHGRRLGGNDGKRSSRRGMGYSARCN
jgi:hypothetical protein